jgi:hypothetical protein
MKRTSTYVDAALVATAVAAAGGYALKPGKSKDAGVAIKVGDSSIPNNFELAREQTCSQKRGCKSTRSSCKAATGVP